MVCSTIRKGKDIEGGSRRRQRNRRFELSKFELSRGLCLKEGHTCADEMSENKTKTPIPRFPYTVSYGRLGAKSQAEVNLGAQCIVVAANYLQAQGQEGSLRMGLNTSKVGNLIRLGHAFQIPGDRIYCRGSFSQPMALCLD